MVVKEYHEKVFDIKNLGELKYFLGIEVVCFGKNTLFPKECIYTVVLMRSKKLGAWPVDSPLLVNHWLRANKGELLYDPRLYQRLLWRVIYLLILNMRLVSQFVALPWESSYGWCSLNSWGS